MFVVVLGSAGLMHAQSSTDSMQKKMTMNGTVCRSSCVTSSANNVASCDPNCTDKTSEAVLVDDQGNVMKIANQDICTSHMGKHVKTTAMPMSSGSGQSIQIMELVDLY
jgi:hypothetical protein